MDADFARCTDAWIAHAVTGALSGAAWIGAAGLAFAMLAAWPGADTAMSRWPAALALLLALPQLWLLLRVAIDQRLFAALAAGAPDQPGLARLDAALLELGWMPAARAARPLAERARGALRLVRASAALTVCQLLLALLSLMLR
ncbi:hypothetical protein [Cupriavidus neocaledonicus]|uniref:Uncharacterized protein n=1 Tax=Cupriavidus neocaledonicus TaxID=1040979 RepID=A0A375H752_9BURK|nr:hypothetical protein [Cupriavidus neocaledonicus]SOZ35072.1 conserved membrane hypothetical protein [Cupriavidus neocaledonicus]SPD47015.1 conserved membrane protein of unknown function [Cupriavidus neocaledonicus]